MAAGFLFSRKTVMNFNANALGSSITLVIEITFLVVIATINKYVAMVLWLHCFFFSSFIQRFNCFWCNLLGILCNSIWSFIMVKMHFPSNHYSQSVRTCTECEPTTYKLLNRMDCIAVTLATKIKKKSKIKDIDQRAEQVFRWSHFLYRTVILSTKPFASVQM